MIITETFNPLRGELVVVRDGVRTVEKSEAAYYFTTVIDKDDEFDQYVAVREAQGCLRVLYSRGMLEDPGKPEEGTRRFLASQQLAEDHFRAYGTALKACDYNERVEGGGVKEIPDFVLRARFAYNDACDCLQRKARPSLLNLIIWDQIGPKILPMDAVSKSLSRLAEFYDQKQSRLSEMRGKFPKDD